MGYLEILKSPGIEERFRQIKAHTGAIYCIKFDPTGKYFAAGSADSTVSLWDAKTVNCLGTFGHLDSQVRTLSFSFDGKFIASGGEDPVIDISDVETGASVHFINQPRTVMNTVAWHPKSYLLAYAGSKEQTNKRTQPNKRTPSLYVYGFQ